MKDSGHWAEECKRLLTTEKQFTRQCRTVPTNSASKASSSEAETDREKNVK